MLVDIWNSGTSSEGTVQGAGWVAGSHSQGWCGLLVILLKEETNRKKLGSGIFPKSSLPSVFISLVSGVVGVKWGSGRKKKKL